MLLQYSGFLVLTMLRAEAQTNHSLNTRRFGYIVHYPSYRDFIRRGVGRIPFIRNIINKLEPALLKRAILMTGPEEWFRIARIKSYDGSLAEGIIVMCPFIPEQIATEGDERILGKLEEAASIAIREGAQIIGLAGFASIVGDEGQKLADRLQIPITSGNTYTAALVMDGVRQAADNRGVDLTDCKMAIVGAAGDIGSVCARVFSKEVRELDLVVRRDTGAEEFVRSFQGSRAEVRVSRSIKQAIGDADVIIAATSSITTLIEADDVMSGCIICDVAIPHNVAFDLLDKRGDIFAFEGGLARIPGFAEVDKPHWWRELSPDGRTVFGCLAEVMLLTLEGRLESFSLGRGRITEEAVRDIGHLAEKHGFELAGFRYRGKELLGIPMNGARNGKRSRGCI